MGHGGLLQSVVYVNHPYRPPRLLRRLHPRPFDVKPRHQTVRPVDWCHEDYHRRPHAGLLGESPSRRFQKGLIGQPPPLDACVLAAALETTSKPQVRKDATFSLCGQTWEVSGQHLAGKRIEVVLDPLTERPIRASYQGRPVVIGRCDPVANSGRGRPAPEAATPPTTTFDPIAGLLARARKDPDHE